MAIGAVTNSVRAPGSGDGSRRSDGGSAAASAVGSQAAAAAAAAPLPAPPAAGAAAAAPSPPAAAAATATSGGTERSAMPAQNLNEPGRWDFFISHTQRNGDAVAPRQIYYSLKQRGHSVWLDVK